MTNKTALAGLALAVLALGACGGGSSSGSGSVPPVAGGSASASAAPVPSGATPAGAASSAASPSDAGPSAAAAAGVGDPCKVLRASDISELTGVEVQEGTSQAVSTSTVCTWLPKDGTKTDAAVFSGQEGPLPGPLSQIEGELKSEFDGTVGPLSVPGADDARYITGNKSGLKIIDVLAQKDHVFYQVLVAAPHDVGRHKQAAITMAERLVKG